MHRLHGNVKVALIGMSLLVALLLIALRAPLTAQASASTSVFRNAAG